jgi:hypothetical protein
MRIEGPRDDVRVSGPPDEIVVRGMVGLGRAPEREPMDLVVLLDVSAATDEPSGLDVDADGEIGVHPGRYLRILQPSDYDLHCTDPDDTILVAEIAAANRLIWHAGGDAYGRISLLEFTTDPFPRASRRALTPRVTLGAVNLFTRLRELRDGAKPRPLSQLGALQAVLATQQTRRNARRVVALFAATPAVPPGGTEPPHAHSNGAASGSEALAAATALRSSGIELHVFGFGPSGDLSQPALSAFARSAGGTYRGIRIPSDVTGLFGSDLDDLINGVEIENLDSGTGALDVVLSGDGSFSGYVLLHEGTNRIRVHLDTPLNVRGDREVVVYFERKEPSSWEILRELERTHSRNRELYRLIEREKALRRGRFPKDVEVQLEP